MDRQFEFVGMMKRRLRLSLKHPHVCKLSRELLMWPRVRPLAAAARSTHTHTHTQHVDAVSPQKQNADGKLNRCHHFCFDSIPRFRFIASKIEIYNILNKNKRKIMLKPSAHRPRTVANRLHGKLPFPIARSEIKSLSIWTIASSERTVHSLPYLPSGGCSHMKYIVSISVRRIIWWFVCTFENSMEFLPQRPLVHPHVKHVLLLSQTRVQKSHWKNKQRKSMPARSAHNCTQHDSPIKFSANPLWVRVWERGSVARREKSRARRRARTHILSYFVCARMSRQYSFRHHLLLF